MLGIIIGSFSTKYQVIVSNFYKNLARKVVLPPCTEEETETHTV